MPAPNPYTSAKILEAGKQEFLQHGYEGASMRQIARSAGVTTGAIYGYFADKAALFEALVKEPADELMDHFMKVQQEFDAMAPASKVENVMSYTGYAFEDVLEFIYDHLDAFKLVISASGGTAYADYVDRFVQVEVDYTCRFFEALRLAGREAPMIHHDVVHMICSACYHGMFQVIARDISKRDALKHIHQLNEFYRAGWSQLMKL